MADKDHARLVREIDARTKATHEMVLDLHRLQVKPKPRPGIRSVLQKFLPFLGDSNGR